MQNKGIEKYKSSVIGNKFNIFLVGIPKKGHVKNRERIFNKLVTEH